MVPFHAVWFSFRSDDNTGTCMVLDCEGSLARSTTVKCPNAPGTYSMCSGTPTYRTTVCFWDFWLCTQTSTVDWPAPHGRQ